MAGQSPRRIATHQPHADRAEIRGHIRHELRRRRRIAFPLAEEHLDRRTSERDLSCQRFVQRGTYPIPVTSLGRRRARTFFRRQIRRSSTNDVFGAAEVVREQLRDETEVEYDDTSLWRHQHIGRFDISMELPQAMQR